MRCWLLLLLLVTACSVVGAVEFYVSPSGSDRNAGTRRAPFATLERARMAVRTAKRDGRRIINLVNYRKADAQVNLPDGKWTDLVACAPLANPVTLKADTPVLAVEGAKN